MHVLNWLGATHAPSTAPNHHPQLAETCFIKGSMARVTRQRRASFFCLVEDRVWGFFPIKFHECDFFDIPFNFLFLAERQNISS